MRRFTAAENDAGVRLSRFVLRVTRGLPNNVMYKAFRTGRVKVNGKKAPADGRLAAGDTVELYLNDEYFPDEHGAWRPEVTGPLPDYGTVYEDAGLAVLFKPAGVFSHRSSKGAPGLLEAFTDALIRRGDYSPAGENLFAPALAGRLDYGTEGLVLAAKKAPALRDAGEIIRLDRLEKQYRCVCVGAPPEGVHSAFLARDRAAKTVKVTRDEAPGAKPITTGVRVLEAANGLSLCAIDLITGRTHQIRAHLAFLGAPVAGDQKYGNPGWNARLGLGHQALCAWELAFAEALPEGGSLGHLAGRRFSAEGLAALPGWWQAWKSQ